MSSPPFDVTLELAPRASTRALVYVFVLHVVLLALILLALKPGNAMALLAGAVAVSWIVWRRHAVFGFGWRALTRLTWHADGRWTLRDAAANTHDGATLDGSSLVHDHLLVLNFRLADGGRRTRVLVGDELPPEPMRRLRARLHAAKGR